MRSSVLPTLVSLCLGAIGHLTAQPYNTGVSGKVVSQDGSAVAGIQVIALAPPPRQTVVAAAATNTDGTFSLLGMPPGDYMICPKAVNFIDPCIWSASPPRVAVSVAKVSTGNMVLERGATVKVRLNDPAKLIGTKTAAGVPYHVLLGVWTPAKLFLTLRLANQDAEGRDYELLVPLNAAVKLTVVANFLALRDAANNPVPSTGIDLPLQFTAAQVEPLPLVFSVAGPGR